MTIITEIDLKFKSGNDVQDVRLTREEWLQVKSYIEGIRTGRGCCDKCRQPIVANFGGTITVNGFMYDTSNGVCASCQHMETVKYMRKGGDDD